MVIRRMDELDAEVNVLVVQDARDVSDAVVERTGIRHESPQAIILKNGEAIYYASHYSISPQAIQAELNS
jgi:thioredoxin 1